MVSFGKEIVSQAKETEMQVRYYISSANLTAEKFARSIREHWEIENRLHWCLDTAMNEDGCRIRRGNAALIFPPAVSGVSCAMQHIRLLSTE